MASWGGVRYEAFNGQRKRGDHLSDSGNGPSRWGIDKDYARLNDVLLGRPENYRWVEAGPIIQRTLQNAEKTGAKFDLQVAMAQHEEMVRIYEDAGASPVTTWRPTRFCTAISSPGTPAP